MIIYREERKKLDDTVEMLENIRGAVAMLRAVYRDSAGKDGDPETAGALSVIGKMTGECINNIKEMRGYLDAGADLERAFSGETKKDEKMC